MERQIPQEIVCSDLFLSDGVIFAFSVPEMTLKEKCDISGCNTQDAG